MVPDSFTEVAGHFLYLFVIRIGNLVDYIVAYYLIASCFRITTELHAILCLIALKYVLVWAVLVVCTQQLGEAQLLPRKNC